MITNFFSIELSLNLFGLILVSTGFFLAGYLLRKGKLMESRKRILQLEAEMLNNHAEILELQKERNALQTDLQLLQALVPVTD